MSTTNVSALSKSDLNPFLFADIGREANGSKLTMLSMLARLEKDPWAQAATWSRVPRSAAIDGLAASIAKMPLEQATLKDAHTIASRLILLLPRNLVSPDRLTATLESGRPFVESGRTFLIGLSVVFWLFLMLTFALRLETIHSPFLAATIRHGTVHQ